MVPSNSASGGFAYNWQSKWVGIIAIKTEKTQIHFLSDVLVAVAPLDLKVPNITVGLTDRGPITSRLNWPIRWITRISNTINWRDTTHFNFEDDYCRGCRNNSHWQQHFHSGLRSPRRPCLMNLLMKWLLQLGPVQLFEGRLALTMRKILTPVSFSFVQNHFSE